MKHKFQFTATTVNPCDRKSRILIRFNTKFEEDSEKRKWRLLVDGEESLAHKITFYTFGETITETIPTGEVKHHILCEGTVRWEENHHAKIFP
jgi:hypothetical protein